MDVAEPGALVKLAERYGLLILHWSDSGTETYVVQDDSATYRFRVASAQSPVPSSRQRSSGRR